MNLVVTGGAGFIGSHLVRALAARGDTVTVIENFSTGARRNLEGFGSSVRVIEHDLSAPDTRLAGMLEGAICVFHLAALPSVSASVCDPLMSHRHCLTATLTLLQAMKQAKVPRVVYSSSCAVYGNQPELPWQTRMAPLPASPYAAAKLAGEYYLAVFNSLYGLETVSLRYFNVYGPGQSADSPYAAVVPRFIEAIRAHKPLMIYGDGLQTRDFVHVSDVVQANLQAMGCRSPAIVNVGSGKPTTILELTELLRERSRVVDLEFHEARIGEVRHSYADVEESARLLGCEASVDLRDGLQELLSGAA